MRFTGGSGSGVASFNSKSLNVCKVNSSGIVTGLAAGTCLITVGKTATTRFMSAISNTVVINVKASAQSALQRDSKRNWLIYQESGQGYNVLVNLASGYANNSALLQLRTYIRGKLIYKTLGTLSLDESGDAQFNGQKALLKGSRLRLVIEGSNIKYGTTI